MRVVRNLFPAARILPAMDDTTHFDGTDHCDSPPEFAGRRELPRLSNDERAFWRRAVEIERARQGRARPVPFPFQEA